MLIKNVVICKSSEQAIDTIVVNIVDTSEPSNNYDIKMTYDDLDASQKTKWDDFFAMADAIPVP